MFNKVKILVVGPCQVINQNIFIIPLSTNPTKWSNTLKQIAIRKSRRIV